jgi:hypothetical protein
MTPHPENTMRQKRMCNPEIQSLPLAPEERACDAPDRTFGRGNAALAERIPAVNPEELACSEADALRVPLLYDVMGRSSEEGGAMAANKTPADTEHLLRASRSRDPRVQSAFENYCGQTGDASVCGDGQLGARGAEPYLTSEEQRGRLLVDRAQKGIADIGSGPGATFGAAVGHYRSGGDPAAMERGAKTGKLLDMLLELGGAAGTPDRPGQALEAELSSQALRPTRAEPAPADPIAPAAKDPVQDLLQQLPAPATGPNPLVDQ